MTVEQVTLPLGGFEPLPAGEYRSLDDRFWAFHEANPWVLDALVVLADDMRAQGRSRIGIGMLFEVLRWHSYRATDGDDYRLNNSYRSRYVRLIQAARPDLADMFETRQLHTP